MQSPSKLSFLSRYTLALEHPDFRWVWLGSLGGQSAYWALIVTRGVLVLEMTGSSTLVGIVTFAAMAPRHVIVLADPNGGGDFAAPVGIITRRDLSVRVEQLPYRHEGHSPRGGGRAGGGESDAPTPLLASDQAADHLSETPAVTDRAAASAVGSQSIELMDANPTTGDAGTKASYAAPPAPASSSVGDAQIEALDRSERGE